jgi:hypothetical protein
VRAAITRTVLIAVTPCLWQCTAQIATDEPAPVATPPAADGGAAAPTAPTSPPAIDGGAAPQAGSAADAAPPTPTHASDYVFDDARLDTYTLTVAPADWQKLQDTILMEQYVPATLRVGDVDIGKVGVRYKGYFTTLRGCLDAAGKIICKKMSFKVKIDEYEPGKRYRGLKHLMFNSMKADDTLLHERLAYKLFRDMGVLAPRCTHAKLVINGEAKGLFSFPEAIDGRFLDVQFPANQGNGNLYKEVWPQSADPKFYEAGQKTNEGMMPPTKFVTFYKALAAASEADLPKVVSSWLDADYQLRYLAVDEAIKNWDGPRYFPCNSNGTSCKPINFYFYESQTENHFWQLPYDFDMTFWPTKGGHDSLPAWNQPVADCSKPIPVAALERSFQPGWCDRVYRGLAGLGRDRYAKAVAALLDGPFDVGKMSAQLDAWAAQLSEAVKADANGPTFTAWTASVAKLKSDLQLHRKRMEGVRDANRTPQ